ncbi:hypothetical protein [Pseudomonas syringae]|uniref:Uncharacterized protein n=1 Tax=Pseudomonas syringae pv. papulans TaxID=83963 RepID=A0A3M6DGR9_PSESX|nr:hypothetical protein [Pseudomonas syringae]KWS38260.1 hypothetical protein AL059_26995 [Pseudomonas syringae pv. papulans]MDH4606834.1 hypothetical protein [Pseudomonas syringae pv. papulans]MDH4622149.1 hypothetical protein [Pseudomonas syringae pv. papulans]RMN47132.1 hypothetical protein ALQ60_200411 [Pseudomonas syringae pv. papulans]RMN84538.1 hypothetical protein ALQ56_03328 [Pseudomonas syringae pv. papulans]
MDGFLEYLTNHAPTLSLLMSFSALCISVFNGRIQKASYQLTRTTHRSGTNDLHVVSSEQLKDSVLVKLVYFNPGSIATVIQSLAVYEVPKPVWWLPRRFHIAQKSRIEKAKWWPAGDGDEKNIKLFADNFEYLIVNNSRVIFVRLPGMINRLDHAFELKTNHGSLVTTDSLDFIEREFSFDSKRRFS